MTPLCTIDQSRLNYEEENQHQIRIRFFNQSNSVEKTFTIDIFDINEPPYHLQCSYHTGFCTAFDEDINQTLTFQIKTTNRSHSEILCMDNGQPSLSVSRRIDVLPDDLTLICVPISSLRIPVVDANNMIDTRIKDNIVILYSNDGDKTELRQRRQANSPPQEIYFNMFDLSIPENSRDFEIANLRVVDQDNDNYTRSVYTYNVSEHQQPFEINNGILRTSLTMHNNNYNLDFETVPTYDIVVTCYDPIHHFTISKNFSIDVTDVNETPVELTLTPNTFPENSPAGYVIGQFRTVDPDIFAFNQTFNYMIVTDPNQMFRIENDRLILSRENDVDMCIFQPELCPHDYEQRTSVYVRIRVEDNGQPQASQKFWIQIRINDENDPPVNLQFDANLIKENSPMGTLVGLFSVQDQDLYQTHIFTLHYETPSTIDGNLFLIEDNALRLARALDYEQNQFVTITVQAIDNGTIPKTIIREFLIEILDVDELPNTYIFLSNTDGDLTNTTINDLVNGKQPVRTIYLPQIAYSQNSLGRIAFLMEDRDRDVNLYGIDPANESELAFSKPICEVIKEIPYRLLCTSIVTVANRRPIDTHNNDEEYLVTTPLVLTSNEIKMTFAKPLRLKFENIILTIDNRPTGSITILKHNSIAFQIGAVDLAAVGQPVRNVTLNPNSSLSYPLEMINSTILKIRDDVNFSSLNASVLVTTTGEDSRVIEKYLTIYVKDKMDFNLILSNNKTMENSHENTSVGNFILENGIEDSTMELVDNADGRFKLNGTNLLTMETYLQHCHVNRTCPLNHEIEPMIYITIAVRDPSTNETLRLISFPIETEDENELPYNLTLSTDSIPDNTPVRSVVDLINAIDDDFNQTLSYSTNNSIFTTIDNQLILRRPLTYDHRRFIPVIIRATDNGQPSTFTEKFFLIKITTVNRPPISVTSTLMTVYYPRNSNSTSMIAGEIRIIDPDVNENFTITFNRPNLRVSTPIIHSYSIIFDEGNVVYAQIYNITIEDFDLSTDQDKIDYLANITDSGHHSISYKFFVHYVPRSIDDSTVTSTIPPASSTIITSLSQALHIRIYETTPPNMPIVCGLLSSSSSNDTSAICTTRDDQTFLFPTNTTKSVFIIVLPTNYTLNSTFRPTILLNVQCHVGNRLNVNQDIVIDVLPTPPTIQINFNQTQPFDPTNNHRILGTVSLIELTTTNRTYNLLLINEQETFQLLSNGSLIQIGSYQSNLFQVDNPHINLTIQAVETTSNEPTRLIQTTVSIAILINSSRPFLTFSRASIPNNTNSNTIIANLTVHNFIRPYRFELIDTYNHGLEIDSNTQTITLKRSIKTFPLINNQTQLPIRIALLNETNGTVLSTMFPLTITYTSRTDPCLDRDCGNGTCLPSNETSSYCLCTGGYRGIDCRTIDSCAYNPCANNGICQQLSSTGDFICQCLPNHSGSFCQTLINVCQVNTSLCLSTEICIPINNNFTRLFTCVSKEKLQYFVFDYLKDRKDIDIINDENLPKRIEDFIRNNLFPIDNLVLPDRRILGPEKYDRAELLSVAIPSSDTTLYAALEIFCINQSLIMNSFAREICAGYQQAIDHQKYFQDTPQFCPNSSFIDAVDKYYWFDTVIPFLPLWIALIVGSLLVTGIPLIPFVSNAPKKVVLPLMKARIRPAEDTDIPVLAKSVRSAVKLSSYSSRERDDSGYESNEETEAYLEQIITNYPREYHVYPLLHTSRSLNMERRGAIIGDLPSSNNDPSPPSRSTSAASIPPLYTQRTTSMPAQNPRRQSSIRNSQTLKPILHRRSTLFDSTFGTLIRLTGTPRFNNDNDTYVSDTFRNENTSKFVIGTLWNTFALVNNLFLQRPKKRRNAISEENIQAEQLHYFAEHDERNELPTNNLQSIIREALLEPESNHLQSIIFDILSSNPERKCTCYGNHHISSCIYYDHSLPYIKRYLDNTSELERIFYDVRKSNKPKVHDVSTQSYVEKSFRTFTHSKTTSHAATQSSPISSLTRFQSHVATQYSPVENRTNSLSQFNTNESNTHNYMNISTQTMENRNNLNESSTQVNPRGIDYTNILPRMGAHGHTYVNTSTQFIPLENDDVSIRYSPIENLPRATTSTSTQVNSKKIEDDHLYDRRNSLMKELKQVISAPTSKVNISSEENKFLPNHTVRSLVSMFETTKPAMKKSNLSSEDKPIVNNPKVFTPLHTTLLNISTEELHSSIIHGTIEQYANDVAINIVDNAVLTATTTAVYHDEQLQRRFSLYNNGGGHGKCLLFQANTFVPLNEIVDQEVDQNLRVESRSSSALLNDRFPSSLALYPENEAQHTLIVGRYVDGPESTPKDNHHFTFDSKFDLESSSDDEPVGRRQFLSNSQLFSAQELYVRPWLVRRATAPDIHCLDDNITDKRVETIESSEAFFPIFPRNNNPLDFYTRFTCLITILFYLYDIDDDNSNQILYDQIEQQLANSISTPRSTIHSNVFQTVNPDGSKRYRTGFVLDVNSSGSINCRKILSQLIEWKRVKIIVRRFRKKYRYYKQLMKIDQKIKSNYSIIHNYLNYFDSTSKRRIKKYAKHYAEKL